MRPIVADDDRVHVLLYPYDHPGDMVLFVEGWDASHDPRRGWRRTQEPVATWTFPSRFDAITADLLYSSQYPQGVN